MLSSQEIRERLYRPVVFQTPERLVSPSSWEGHIPFIYWLIEALNPKVLVELGSYSGNSYCGMCQAIKFLGLSTSSFAVDTWKGDPQAGFYGDIIYDDLKAHHDPRYAGFSRLVRSTFDEALEHFADGSIDLLHIDGYHTYDAVKHDFTQWLPKVSQRGVIVFHDINVRERDFGAWKLWEEELTLRYPSFSFLHCHGLGVLAVGEKIPEAAAWLFSSDLGTENISTIRSFFSFIGNLFTSKLLNGVQDKSVENLKQENKRLLDDLAQRIIPPENILALETELKLREGELQSLEVSYAAKSEELERLIVETEHLSQLLARKELECENAIHELEITRANQSTSQDSSFRLKDQLKKIEEKLAYKEGEVFHYQCVIKKLQSYTAQQETSLQKYRLYQELLSRRSLGESIPTNFEHVLQSKVSESLPSIIRKRALLTAKGVVRGIRSESKIAEVIEKSGLFDRNYYLSQFLPSERSKGNQVLHYIREGAAQGKNPSTLFDSKYYLRKYPDVASQKLNPFFHYLLTGWKEHRSPSPLFDAHYYLRHHPEVADSNMSPLQHFYQFGALLGYSPHPLFSAAHYCAQSPHLALSKLNALDHYIRGGWKENRDPHILFDNAFYRKQLSLLGLPDANPLLDYLLFGADSGRNPHPLFHTTYYLRENPDVAEAGENPLIHYIERGALELRNPHPVFDVRFYRNSYSDLRDKELDFLTHFLMSGAKENRNPNLHFDTQYYKSENSSALAPGENPLIHYLLQGEAEGRRPNPYLDPREYVLLHPEVERCKIGILEHAVSENAYAIDPETRAALSKRKKVQQFRFHTKELARANTSTLVGQESKFFRFVERGKNSKSAARPIVIYTSHVSPFPPRAGNEYRIARMFRALEEADFQVLLIVSPLPGEVLSSEQLTALSENCSNVIVCQKDGELLFQLGSDTLHETILSLDGQLVGNYASILSEDRAKSLRDEKLLEIDQSFCDDCLTHLVTHFEREVGPCTVLTNYIFMTRFLPLLSQQSFKIIDTHDVFSTKKEKVVSFGIKDDLSLSAEEERARLLRADLVLAIQEIEQNELSRLTPEREVITVTVDFDVEIDLRPAKSQFMSKKTVLYVASDNPMNVKGLREFLRFAWPRIRRAVPGVEFLIAGRVGRSVRNVDSDVKILGPVEDLNSLYDQSSVVINPSVAGTGLKIKNLEALCRFRPVVTWPSGCDGMGSDIAQYFSIARDWYEFYQKVVFVLQETREDWFSEHDRKMIAAFLSPKHVYPQLLTKILERSLPADSSKSTQQKGNMQ